MKSIEPKKCMIPEEDVNTTNTKTYPLGIINTRAAKAAQKILRRQAQEARNKKEKKSVKDPIKSSRMSSRNLAAYSKIETTWQDKAAAELGLG